ncbi:MAG: acyl carrier protein [Deltaproteobacteria bacterium]|nr:acyl carrier protein [Deltaproteobacteria bacterium]
MTQAEIFDRVQAMMNELFELDREKITLESHLINDLDLDSLDAIDMAVKLEEITGHRVAEESLKAIRTVADVVHLVDGVVNGKTSPAG